MKKRASSSARPSARWMLLPTVAVVGVLAGLTNAFAFDQQATDDAIDDALNWQAARGGSASGPYAQATYGGTLYVPAHRHFR